MENLAGEVEQMTLQGGKLALKVFQAITIVQEKRSVTVEVCIPSPFNYFQLFYNYCPLTSQVQLSQGTM